MHIGYDLARGSDETVLVVREANGRVTGLWPARTLYRLDDPRHAPFGMHLIAAVARFVCATWEKSCRP